MHSELSEALEKFRRPLYRKERIAEEFADCIIRILDFCHAWKMDIEKAILEKMERNKKREYKHGKRF